MLKEAKKYRFVGLINLGRGEVKNLAFHSTANIRLLLIRLRPAGVGKEGSKVK